MAKADSRAKQSGHKLPLFLILIGLMCMGYWIAHTAIVRRTLQLTTDQIQTEPLTQAPLPTHIAIQWFVDVTIEPMKLVGQTWGVSPDTASYLSSSARPGLAGNIIVYGHNTRQIMGNIRALKGHETISLTTSDGVIHTYTVVRMKETEPSDVSWLQPTTTETLTLYTCSGLLDRKRFLVQAVPIAL